MKKLITALTLAFATVSSADAQTITIGAFDENNITRSVNRTLGTTDMYIDQSARGRQYRIYDFREATPGTPITTTTIQHFDNLIDNQNNHCYNTWGLPCGPDTRLTGQENALISLHSQGWTGEGSVIEMGGNTYVQWPTTW